MSRDFSNLKRQRNPMPDFVKIALEANSLMNAFNNRPAYQQNDYLGWISRAKRQETKLKRLQQMLDELSQGGVYMNMRHPASKNRSLGDLEMNMWIKAKKKIQLKISRTMIHHSNSRS